MEKVFIRGTPPRARAHSRALSMRGSVAEHAGQLEREVGLDGGVHLGWAVRIDVPAAVPELPLKDVVDRLAFPFAVHLPPPMVKGDHVRHQGDVHDQFPNPIAFRFLLGEKVRLRTGDRLRRVPEMFVLGLGRFVRTAETVATDMAGEDANEAPGVKRLFFVRFGRFAYGP